MGKVGPKAALSKKYFLEELAKGKTPQAIFREAGLSTTSTYYNWKRKDKKFRLACEKILGERRKGYKDRRYKAARAGALETIESTGRADGWIKRSGHGSKWQEVFIREYELTKDRVRAADKAGKDVSFVLKSIDPENPYYNPKFAKKYKEMEIRDAVSVEDEAKKKALVHGSESMQKFLLPTLPIVGEKYKKIADRESVGDINIYSLIFTDKASREADKQVREILGNIRQLPTASSE